MQAVENIICFYHHYLYRQITKEITVWNAGEKSQAMLALWGELTLALSGILSQLLAYSWKSLQGCQPMVSSSLCPLLSDAEPLFHADHITRVFYFKLTLNDLSSFANTESNNWFAYSRPVYLSAPSMGQTIKSTPIAYGKKAKKAPLFLGKAAMYQPMHHRCQHTPNLHLLSLKMIAHFFFQSTKLIQSNYQLTGNNCCKEKSELLLQLSHIRE